MVIFLPENSKQFPFDGILKLDNIFDALVTGETNSILLPMDHEISQLSIV
jgi:hypothetical protein